MSRKHRLRWLHEAYTDLHSARDWYEDQIRGLGAEFLEAFWRGIAVIDHTPAVPKTIEIDAGQERVRRHHLSGWPYSIVHLFEHDTIIAIAVHHDRRHPRVRRRRL